MVVAPCKDCIDRYSGCHSKCSKYQQYKVDNEKRKQTEQESKRRDAIVDGVVCAAIRRAIRRRKH